MDTLSNILISFRNVARIYGRWPHAVKALEVGELDVARGDFVAVVGPSGSGKTTLLNLTGGLDRPSRGDIFFGGKNIARLREGGLCRYRREKVGFIFQSYYLLPHLNVIQNVLLPAYPVGNGRKFYSRARELLHLVGLAGKERRRPGELSGGEQQRAAVARALLLDPELILADEPTGNLDSVSGGEIINLLKELNEKGKTVMVATHDRQVSQACRRQIRLEDGMLVSE